jgi:hypothetical protein
MRTLVETARADVIAFLEGNKELLFNERDFQMHLATWLRNSANHYDDVDVEYYVPWQELKNYVWKSELRLDIVVKKDGEYCPIELKYKTKKVERQISRFDELLDEKVIVMKNQGAQDLGMYDFWKDVRRIELVRNRFERVKGGLAVFVTNDVFYTKGCKHSSNNYLLGMAGDVTRLKQKHWRNPESTCAKTHPNFDIEQAYDIVWHSREIDNEYFYYCIVNI